MNDWTCSRCGAENSQAGGACASCGAPRENPGDRTVVLPKVDPLMDAPGLEDNVVVSLDDIIPGEPILVVRGGDTEGDFYRLASHVMVLGRQEDVDVLLDDITVSRRHCELARDGDGFRVTDLGSLNGTYVNQRRVQVARLGHGDELQVGKYRLVFLENPGNQR